MEFGRNVPFLPDSFEVIGTFNPHVTVTVPGAPSGARGPAVGFVLNNGLSGLPMIPTSDPDYAALARGIHSNIVRISLVDAKTFASWNTNTQKPKFDFTTLDRAINFSIALPAHVLLTLPVGSWGNGNLLPTGMPLDTSLPMTKGLGIGYFPTTSAYDTYVSAVVAHIKKAGLNVDYWSVGNEVPLFNGTVVTKLIQMFNIAEKDISTTFPSVRIGSDAMMNKTFFSQFAQFAHNVGFLSFHYYPSVGLCLQGGAYCPPGADGLAGTTDPTMWKTYADLAHRDFYAPGLAALKWYNATGNYIPVMDTESNFNAIGGGVLRAGGTDPRQQALFGATWLVNTLMDGWNQNLSALTYFTLSGPNSVPSTASGPYGGWGFGLSSEGTSDQNIQYAPYWALWLWGRTVGPGGAGEPGNSSNPAVVRSVAVATSGGGLSVILLNRVALDVHITVTVNGGKFTPSWINTLDKNSYLEQFNSTSQTMTLVKSGLTQSSLPSNGQVTAVIHGYGVSVIHYRLSTGIMPSPVSDGASSAMDPSSSSNSTHVAAGVVGANTSCPTPSKDASLLSSSPTLHGSSAGPVTGRSWIRGRAG